MLVVGQGLGLGGRVFGLRGCDHDGEIVNLIQRYCVGGHDDNDVAYLIFVIFFTQAKFLENKIYTEIYTVNCQFFALNL